ncbi:replication initiation protein [Desulfoplanes formicivorans]|uniref:Primase C-terminal 1 domain-containing protein n=1 Tax=Desulfoplanes formicivorans TaxID=1592317 RepID=A0A194AI36_9BACT|nr:replication initiation protein [Desulfoplanes formicivorans]GAU08890.1 hypothetical protein DPF_1607 [Desulfoplanes formicivorans]
MINDHKFLYYNQFQTKILAIDVDDIYIDKLPLNNPESKYEPGLDKNTFCDIPAPNFTVCTGKGHFQAFWRLKNPIPMRGAARTHEYYSDVRTKLNIALNGDFAFNKRGSARNPFYRNYWVRKWHDDEYELSDLNLNINLFTNVSICGLNKIYEHGNRNIATFYRALYYYKKNTNISFDDLLKKTISWQQMQDEENLSQRENISIIKSVLRNGYKYKIRADRNYGAMNLPKIDWKAMTARKRKNEIRRRQSLGAHYVNKNQVIKNSKIVRDYFKANPHSSIKKAARELKMSRNTIKKYYQKS